MCIYAVFLHVGLHAGSMNISGPFDLNNNTLDEVLLFSENHLRYVEIQLDSSHVLMWESNPENYTIKDAILYDINNDGKTELIILADYLPGKRINGSKWLHLFSWSDSLFIPQTIEIDNGELLHPNHFDVDDQSGILSIAVGSPYRAAVLLEVDSEEQGLVGNTVNIELPNMLHNGFGPVFSSFMNLNGEAHLAVFSLEKDTLKTTLFRADEKAVIVTENALHLNSALILLGSAIQKTDLDNDQREELQLPFENGEVLTLEFVDSALVLSESPFNRQNLFNLPDSADSESINQLLSNRIEVGLDVLDNEPYPDFVIAIIPNDTLRLGDTLNYKAAMDTSTGFYSFHWLSKPPANAYFNPSSGSISWIPRRENIGVHEFKFYTEQWLNDELVSDEDELGDRHRILPVLEESEQSYAVIVVDTTKPPIIYAPPPYEPYSVMVHTPNKTAGTERFLFDGVPPFSVMVDEINIPKYPSFSHSIFANLGRVNVDKHVDFSYTSNKDSSDNMMTLTLSHKLTENVIYAKIEPFLDSLNTTANLNPSNWRANLQHYPMYEFEGFPESMRLDDNKKGISLYTREAELKIKNNSYISVLTPLSDNRHSLSIYMKAIELWNITGDVKIDSLGNKTVNTTIKFSGEFSLYSINAEMYTDEEIAMRSKEMKFKILEFMGVDSVVVDSVGTNIR